MKGGGRVHGLFSWLLVNYQMGVSSKYLKKFVQMIIKTFFIKNSIGPTLKPVLWVDPVL